MVLLIGYTENANFSFNLKGPQAWMGTLHLR